MATTKRRAKPKSKSAKSRTSGSTAKRGTSVRRSTVKHNVKTMRASSKHEGEFMKFSGKFTVRLPRSLHQALVDRAEREGVSLNLFVTNALSRTVAMPSSRSKR